MRSARLAAGVLALGLAGCGGSAIDASAATQFWRQSVAAHYHGVVATGDGRGCVQVSSGHFSCTAYVRNHANSLSSGIDVLGTVTSNSQNTTVHARQATGAEIQAWFAKTGGVS